MSFIIDERNMFERLADLTRERLARENGEEVEQQNDRTTEVEEVKKGTCVNCERPDMIILGKGLCGGCYTRAKGKEGAAREAALTLAKEDFQGKGNLSGQRGKRAVPDYRKRQKNMPDSMPRKSASDDPPAGFGEDDLVSQEEIRVCEHHHVPKTQVIPVTLKLTIEVDLRVNGISY
jgi:hypothetical protein